MDNEFVGSGNGRAKWPMEEIEARPPERRSRSSPPPAPEYLYLAESVAYSAFLASRPPEGDMLTFQEFLGRRTGTLPAAREALPGRHPSSPMDGSS